MKIFGFFFPVLLLFFSLAQAQTERYYGKASTDESFYSISKNANGDFSLLGTSESQATDGVDFFLAKTNAQGQQQWTHQWHYFKQDVGKKVLTFPNGDMLVVGYGFDPLTNTYKGYYARFDGTGQVVWENVATAPLQDMQLVDAMFTSDGNILMLGNHFSQPYTSTTGVIKVSTSGSLLYAQNYGANVSGTTYSFAEKSNGDVLIGVEDAVAQNIITISSSGLYMSIDAITAHPLNLKVAANNIYVSDRFSLEKYDLSFNQLWQISYSNGGGILTNILSNGNLMTIDGNTFSEVAATDGTILWTQTLNPPNRFYMYLDGVEKNASEWVFTGYGVESGVSMGGTDGLFDLVSGTDGTPISTSLLGQTGVDADEYGQAVVESVDGGIVMMGSANVDRTQMTKVIKASRSGAVEWETTLGQPYEVYNGWSICNANNGGYVIMGYQSDSLSIGIFATKLDAQGVQQWSKLYPTGTSSPIFGSVKPYPTGGYVIAGNAVTPSGQGNCIIRIDNNGDTLWIKYFRFSNNNNTYDMCIANDGGIVVAGRCRITGSNINHSWLMKTDANGNLVWNKTYISLPTESSRFTSVVENPSTGDLYAYGLFSTSVSGGIENSCLIKTDSNGDSLNHYVLQGSATLGRRGYKARLNSANEVLLFGLYALGTDMLVRQASISKLNPNLNLVWDKQYTYKQAALVYDAYVTNDDSLVALGSAINPDRGYADTDFYLLSTDSDGRSADIAPRGLDFKVSLYPNPTANGIITLAITTATFEPLTAEVYDINGKRLQTTPITQQISTLSLESLASGAYFVRVFDKNNRAITRTVVK